LRKNDFNLLLSRTNKIITKKTYISSVLPIIIDSFPNEFQSDGLLGADFLSKNRVKIDFKNKQMWIQPVAKK